MNKELINEDWEILQKFLPNGWKKKAIELRALTRRKKIKTADILLRLLLIHLVSDKSLRTTSAYSKEANLCNINDVALLHRLKVSGEWLRWMSVELEKALRGPKIPLNLFAKYRIRLVDGTAISEPGSTGTDWRIHYSFELQTFKCDTFEITSPREGESFQMYRIRENDLLIGDRNYCKRKGIMHILNNKGQVLVRFHSTSLPLLTRRGRRWSVLENLRMLPGGDVGDWDVWFQDPDTNQLVKGRFCAIRKSKKATEKAKRQLMRHASKENEKLKQETLELAEYVLLFTTVNRHNFNAKELLSLYRGRWQIELVFKRLKRIIGIGHLPKYNPESCIAWLHGKMFVALLVERIYQEAEFFSPWGYPLQA